MKKVMLFRHAKSDWGATFQEDRDRPLASRGRYDARMVGRFLQDSRLQPDLILVSPATRARSTVELAVEEGNWEAPVRVIERIYGASPNELIGLVRQQDDEAQRVMLVGHNPTFEESLARFVGGGAFKMPTAAIALIEVPAGSWKRAVAGSGVLRWLVKPKLLKKTGWG